MNKINERLKYLNPDFLELSDFIHSKIAEFNTKLTGKQTELFSEKQTILITYPDQFSSEGRSHFELIDEFMQNDLRGCVSLVHILPFYPWTSDDGFAPINYHEVDKDYGSWDDVSHMKADKMFDCVFNHVSSHNDFFKKALEGDRKCAEMFHIYNEEEFNSDEFQESIPKVVRPRTSPLFTAFDIKGKPHYVWTTFGSDQIDTNLQNVDMLKYILECFFLYIEKGARFFRIDAVPFFWKELGTNCSHLPQTHGLVKIFRSIVDEINCSFYIVTESNVPHNENITYWGSGSNEAHIIYNFSLAPLILHALTFKSSKYIEHWAQKVFEISQKVTYLNFTATHDGIGMRGLEGIVPDEDIQTLCGLVESKNGVVGKKRSRDGSIRPYELNITWASYMQDDKLDHETRVNKLVNSHAIVMFFPGIGAHYVHNFLGTKNWQEGYADSGVARRLNRKKFQYPLEYDAESLLIKDRLVDLINYKCSHPAFSPKSDFKILSIHENVLAFSRSCEAESFNVYFNLTEKSIILHDLHLDPYELKFEKN